MGGKNRVSAEMAFPLKSRKSRLRCTSPILGKIGGMVETSRIWVRPKNW